jgi:LysR family nitrogen assimilation transcriptional regulator
MAMDLKQLEWFVRVAELGSFTKAAATLDMSQPVLSRQVRQLELELQQHLLYRNGRGVTPTESGRRLLEHGRGILHQVELARQELRDREATPVGKVVVGLPPSIGKLLTVRLVEQFRERYAQASIGIAEGLSTQMQEWLLLGRLDVALLYNPPINPQLEYERVRASDVYLIGAPAGIKGENGKGAGGKGGRARLPATVRMAELPQYPLIIPSRPNVFRNLIESECARHGIKLNVLLEIDSIAAVLDLVERGIGYAALTSDALHGHQSARPLSAARIVSPAISTPLVIATAAQRPLSSLARHTIALIKSELAQAPAREAESSKRPRAAAAAAARGKRRT